MVNKDETSRCEACSGCDCSKAILLEGRAYLSEREEVVLTIAVRFVLGLSDTHFTLASSFSREVAVLQTSLESITRLRRM